ncbi:MAG: complex I NDUFA9 subunit family protein [Rhodospirillales bacterium]|jgi:NADH dehydrogenase|nr:complex I NDUFA9 subunit family protein [Rhodospirillaceae bacterium]MAG99038.1 complex I NDUFA9 subunit family protein [Rhodospirillaceae bacterium]MDP6573328.1 complex I NDUFA9 subunit family protein [Rhodospirillales bacterium]MDP6773801.1 complex I NDUFA9 subunit family protein [Rhodospirillales bacterium]
MNPRVVTVFGGSGFLGRHLVKRLAAEGAIVRVAVRDPEGTNYLKPLGDVGQIVPWPADVTDRALVGAAVAGADTVVNLVGILFERGRSTFQRVHVEGAANVAAAAKEAGARRLVQVSALGADANSPADYGRTKAAGEVAALDAFPDATVVRPSVVFGSEDKFFNLFAGMARLLPVLPVFGCPTIPKVSLFGEDGLVKVDLYGNGGTKFQPVYAGDVADAIMGALSADDSKGRTFELGGPRVYSFKEIMELMLATIGRRRLLVPWPFAIANIQAWFLELAPVPLLTRDQLRLLQRDNVVSAGALTLADLGIEAAAAEAILPTYLHVYQHAGERVPRTA